MIASLFEQLMLSNKNNEYPTQRSMISSIFLCFLFVSLLSLLLLFSSTNVSANEFPNAELISPEPENVYNSSILIEWTATDPYGLDLEVVLYVKEEDSNEWIRISEEPLENTGSFLWDCKNVSDGHYSVQISVMNEEGRGDGDKTGIFTIDNDNSLLEISEVTMYDTENNRKEYISNNEDIVLKASITHAEHVSKNEIWADLHHLGRGMMVEPNSFDGNQAIWDISLIRCVPQEGPIVINISVDNLETGSITVIADNTPPKITISKPDKGFYFSGIKLLPINNLIVFGFIDIDIAIVEQNEIKEVNYYIDGNLVETIHSSPYRFQITTPLFGFHKISVQAIDGTGFSDKTSVSGFFFIF